MPSMAMPTMYTTQRSKRGCGDTCVQRGGVWRTSWRRRWDHLVTGATPATTSRGGARRCTEARRHGGKGSKGTGPSGPVAHQEREEVGGAGGRGRQAVNRASASTRRTWGRRAWRRRMRRPQDVPARVARGGGSRGLGAARGDLGVTGESPERRGKATARTAVRNARTEEERKRKREKRVDWGKEKEGTASWGLSPCEGRRAGAGAVRSSHAAASAGGRRRQRGFCKQALRDF